MAFTQDGNKGERKSGANAYGKKTKTEKKAGPCFYCGGDYWIRDCKDVQEAGQLHVQNLINEGEDPDDANHLLAQVRMMFYQSWKWIINEDWLLLDSHSTLDIFKNKKKLANI